MYIPAKKHLKPTSEDDPLKYYFYYFPMGYLMRLRLYCLLSLLNGQVFPDFLEAGYGSGIMLPELTRHVNGKVFALDTHDQQSSVAEMLQTEHISDKVVLLRGSVLDMPFKDGQFSGIAAVSILEHIRDIDRAVEELYRITRKGGRVFLGVPVHNFFIWLLSKLTKWNYREHHVTDHQRIITAIRKKFVIERVNRFPGFVPVDWGMYLAISCRRE